MDKCLSHSKNGGIGVIYCWNYGPPKLLLHFIEYCLEQLNNKHKKIAMDSTIHFFESHYQKKYLVKVFWSTNHKTRYLRNWTETIWHSVYWKCIIWAKSDLPIINSVCGEVWFTINGLSKMLFFNFNFSFFHVSNDYCQKSYGKPSFL